MEQDAITAGLQLGKHVWAKARIDTQQHCKGHCCIKCVAHVAQVRGYCPWPAVVWSLDLVRRADIPGLARAHKAGQVLVNFFGEHTVSWVDLGAGGQPELVDTQHGPAARRVSPSMLLMGCCQSYRTCTQDAAADDLA